ERENLVELELNSETKNRAKVNRSDTSSPREILGYINTVSFTPEDSRIIHDDPSDRRAFIDQLLIQFTPRLAAVFGDYERALKQRNSLLKSSRGLPKNSPGLSTLDAWDESLIEHGAEIISQRFELATKLAPYLSAAYKSISEDNREATLTVVSTVLSEGNDVDGEQQAVTTPDRKLIAEKFKERLIELRSKELERGVTLVGPHRDELKLMLGEYPAKGYISYGEAWSFAVSLKLASAELLRAEAQAGDPILILDDVFSSLDDQRLERLLDLVSNYEQVIITDAIRGKQESFQSATRFLIAEGMVTQL
ncbi:MAG: DNA replication and repair protein RecF, partial [Acidobacteria bacterium]|nr:DNA replication and repair protein RecF [Acidobacteriota bacterium]